MGTIRLNLITYRLVGGGKEKQWKIFRKVGEPPVYYDSTKHKMSADKMHQYLFSNGYFDNIVSKKSKFKKRSVKVLYEIETGEPYRYKHLQHKINHKDLRDQYINIADQSLIKEGAIFSQVKLDEERYRISRAFKDSGYFFFDENAVIYDLDTNASENTIDFTLRIIDHKDESIDSKHIIEQVFVHGNYDVLLDKANNDTIMVDGIHVISDQLEKYNWTNILNKVLIRPGLVNSFKNYFELTYDHLLGLSLFNYVDIKFESNIENDSLVNCHIYLKSSKKLELNAELEGNTGTGNSLQNSNTLGLASRLTYRNKNIFKGGQIFQIVASGEIETQLNPVDRVNNQLNTLNLSLTTGLEFPNFLFVNHQRFRDYQYYRSRLNLSYNIEDRLQYIRLEAINLNLEYDWNKTKQWKHSFSPVSLNYLTSDLGTQIQSFIEQNIQLKNSLENQWILGSDYHVTYTNQYLKNNPNFWIVSGGLDLAGNSLYTINNLSGGHILDSIAGTPFSQFVKLDADIRKYISFGYNTSLAFRLTGGVGKAIGNSNVLPYIKQFYIGGANSIRAWRLRTLGPGSYSDSTLYSNNGDAAVILDQTGEMKLEWNSELRFPLSKSLRGAIFVDMGNIWNLKVDKWRPGARFAVSTMYNDIAIGTGLGVRWDFSFFIVRLDWGLKLKDPRFVAQEQWVLFNDNAWKVENINYEYSILNIAIGYPF